MIAAFWRVHSEVVHELIQGGTDLNLRNRVCQYDVLYNVMLLKYMIVPGGSHI